MERDVAAVAGPARAECTGAETLGGYLQTVRAWGSEGTCPGGPAAVPFPRRRPPGCSPGFLDLPSVTPRPLAPLRRLLSDPVPTQPPRVPPGDR